jgi:signal transduction histidine kinase
VLLGWAEWTNWHQVSRLRQRLREVELDSEAAEFQTRLLTLHGSLLAAALQPPNGHLREAYTTGSVGLSEWLRSQNAASLTTDDPGEVEILGRIERQYAAYRVAVNRWLENDPTASGDPIQTAITPLLRSVEAWKDLHHTLLEGDITEVRQSLRVLHALLLTSFILLIMVAVFAAWLVQSGLIAPLRRELVASHALLARQEKLASLGVLAAGVAHEIRNPLTAIKARLFSQQKRLAAGSPEHTDSQVIGGEISRLERIVRETLQFARPETPAPEILEAGEFLREIRDLIAPSLETRRIALTFEATEPLLVRVDSSQMKQVLINLIQNAAESIGEEGQITLRARRAVLPMTILRTDAVALEVEDNGAGVPSEVQARLFDPFFTTKPAGAGLGLAIAARITQAHGGSLQYRTNPRKGATFSVVLPAQKASRP